MFEDRADAGKRLANVLEKCRGRDTVVFGVPRGGVVVGAEVAKALHAPLDIVVTRKIGHPDNPEYAIAVVGEGGVVLGNVSETGEMNKHWLDAEVVRQKGEVQRRRHAYRDAEKISAKGKVAIVVDDGMATGLSLRAALQSLRSEAPQKLIAALPVAPYNAVDKLKRIADDVVVLNADRDFLGAVGAYYADFNQVSDAEVIQILKQNRMRV